MSYTEIYKFTKEGNATQFAETKNAFRGAMAVWTVLEKKYLPPYKPPYAKEGEEYSRIGSFTNQMKEIWNIFDFPEVPKEDRIVLGSTFDNVIVMREDIPTLIEAFNAFDENTTLKQQADLIQKELDSDPDFIAIAWNQTSVNGSAWTSDSPVINEDEEEEYPPYNMFTEDKHWNLFDDINKIE